MIPNRFKVIYEVTRKEIQEHFKTKRLLVISIIFAIVFIIIAVYGGYLVSGADSDDLAYEYGANNVLNLTLAFTGLFPPILAIALSYDSIVGERTRKSLHLLLSKPVDRSSIFIGKFLGAFLSISIVYLLVCTVGYLIVIGLSGKIPTALEVGNAYGAMLIVLFSAACWVLFIMLFSTSFKTITSTIIFSVLFWLFILNLASQSGLIYYMIVSDTSDEPITIDIVYEQQFLVFSARRIDVIITNFEIELIFEDNTLITPETAREGLPPIYAISKLEKGNYTWTAKYQEDPNSNLETISHGSFYISDTFFPIVYLTDVDNDREYDDLILQAGTGGFESGERFDITLKSKKDNKIIDQKQDFFGLYNISDLKEGDYLVTISKNNITYLDTTVHSYGTKKTSMGMFMVGSDEEVEFPDYVKATFAINPDNAASVYQQILTDDSQMQILTLEEGILALVVTFILLFLLGLLVFSRIELL